MNSDKFESPKSVNYKYCEYCGAPIPRNSEEPYCAQCRERVLFLEIKDYIRANDVNEFQVAAHFGIPLRTVKGWIKEGRIEYKETANGMRSLNNHFTCERCGAPVAFGTLCPKCLKLMNKNMHGYDLSKRQKDDDRMRFLQHDKKKQ